MELENWINAAKELESNPVFLAWRTEQRTRARRSVLQHPALIPLVIAGLSLITVAAATIVRIRVFPYGGGQAEWFFVALTVCLPALAQLWAVPLIYYTIRDAALLLANVPNSRGLTQLVSQAAISPMRDHELLVAALRICWPRLILAAFGSAYLFWIMSVIVAWPVSAHYSNYNLTGNLIDLLLLHGPLSALLNGIVGALGGLILLLTYICLGLEARRDGLVSAAAGVAVLLMLYNSVGNARTFDFNADVYLLDTGYASYLAAVVAACLWILLTASLKWRRMRLTMIIGALALVRFIPLVFLIPLGLIDPHLTADPDTIAGLGWASKWMFDSINILSPSMAPGEPVTNIWLGAVVMEEYNYFYSEEWLRYLLVLILQAALVLLSGYYARRAVIKWRQSGL
jgi:hypothetical protein